METKELPDLISSIKNNDFQSFEVLFNAYWYDLYKYAARVLGSREDAEDLTQELFSDLWENRAHLSIDTHIKAWLFGSLRKKILQKFRDKGIQAKHLEVFKYLSDEASNAPMNAIVSKDILNVLIAQVEEFLPTREKEVFILSQIQGYSVKEIAQQFSTSEQTVRNQISTSLRKIKPLLTKLIVTLMFLILP